jgi:hypothetical protein
MVQRAKLQLSGWICMTPGLRQLYDAHTIRKKPKVGDLKVMSKLDGDGLSAVLGGHCNYGYSGDFHAQVFDGDEWRVVALSEFIPWDIIHYVRQYEKANKLEMLMAVLEPHSTDMLVWTKDGYVPECGAESILAEQERMLETKREAEEEARRLHDEAARAAAAVLQRQREELERKRTIANDLLRTGRPVEGTVSGIKLDDRQEFAGYMLELPDGLQGLLGGDFVIGKTVDARARRIAGLLPGQKLQVTVIRYRKDGTVHVMEHGARPFVIIRDAQESRGGSLGAQVLDLWGGRENPRGLYVRIMGSFRAVLPLEAMAGDDDNARRGAMWNAYYYRYGNQRLRVQLAKVEGGRPPARIFVKQAKPAVAAQVAAAA